VTNLVDQLPNLRAPLLGLFGNEDSTPPPNHVNELEEILKSAGKTYEFHRYDDAATRSSRRPALLQGCRGQRRLGADRRVLRQVPGRLSMCTYATVKKSLDGSAKGREQLVPRDRPGRSTSITPSTRWPSTR